MARSSAARFSFPPLSSRSSTLCSSKSNVSLLIVQVLKFTHFSVPPEELSLQVKDVDGQQVELSCISSPSNPKSELWWFLGELLISSGDGKIKTSRVERLDSSKGFQTFSELKMNVSQALNGSVVRCESVWLGHTVHKQNHQLIVQLPDYPENEMMKNESTVVTALDTTSQAPEIKSPAPRTKLASFIPIDEFLASLNFPFVDGKTLFIIFAILFVSTVVAAYFCHRGTVRSYQVLPEVGSTLTNFDALTV